MKSLQGRVGPIAARRQSHFQLDLMTTPTIASLRQTLQQLRRRRARFFFIKAASLLAIAWAVSALSISLVGAWLEPDKLGSIILFGLALSLIHI